MSIVSTGTQIGKKVTPLVEGRFSSDMGKVTRMLNRIAINETKFVDCMQYTFPKANVADLKRLTSPKLEDTYKRATWTNPKDNKVYHLLEDGRKGGKVQVRILDREGAFVKNAELEPKNIVIFDNFYSPRGVTHGEMMEVFLKRFNPFANVERLEHKKGLFEIIKYRGKNPMHLELKRFSELADKIKNGKKVDYISVSEAHLVDAEDVIYQAGVKQKEYISQSAHIKEISPIFEKIMASGTRIIEAAGNESNFAKEVVSDRLAISGVEGVGSLVKGKVASDSCSRNSIFTQHYERRNYRPTLVKDDSGEAVGINVTGLQGSDLPLNWKTKKILQRKNIGGTSYATPVRVAKLALNDMMQGVL